MIDTSDNLKQARAALLAFEPEKAEAYLRRFEEDLHSRHLTKDMVETCTAELAALRDLAGAACAGVSAAQQQFRDILKLSRHLDTYDSAGKKKAEQVGPRSTRKF